MEKEAFAKYLEDRYYDQMKYYDKKAGVLQKKYKQFQWILIILSALTPVLAAFDNKKLFGFEVDLQITVVATSAIVAILTSGLKTFQYQELWVSYRLTQELLKPEIYYYQFKVGPYAEIGINCESLFVSRVDAILDKEHSGWPASKKLNEKNQNDKEEEGGGEGTAAETNAGAAENSGTGATLSDSQNTATGEEPKN